MSKGKVWLVILGVVFLLLFGVWYFLFGPKPLSSLPSQEEVNSQTSGWETYKDDFHGFKVKIPTDITVTQYKSSLASSYTTGTPYEDINYDGDSIDFEVNEYGISYAECTISVWPKDDRVLPSDENLNWKRNVSINGISAERKHIIISGLYHFEYIVIKGKNFIFELEVDIDEGEQRKKCELIFSTFEFTN